MHTTGCYQAISIRQVKWASVHSTFAGSIEYMVWGGVAVSEDVPGVASSPKVQPHNSKRGWQQINIRWVIGGILARGLSLSFEISAEKCQFHFVCELAKKLCTNSNKSGLITVQYCDRPSQKCTLFPWPWADCYKDTLSLKFGEFSRWCHHAPGGRFFVKFF